MMEFLPFVLNGLALLVLIDAVASWIVPNPNAFPRNVTGAITGPLYAPIRKVLNPEMTGGLDFSPLIIIVALQALANVIRSGGLGL